MGGSDNTALNNILTKLFTFLKSDKKEECAVGTGIFFYPYIYRYWSLHVRTKLVPVSCSVSSVESKKFVHVVRSTAVREPKNIVVPRYPSTGTRYWDYICLSRSLSYVLGAFRAPPVRTSGTRRRIGHVRARAIGRAHILVPAVGTEGRRRRRTRSGAAAAARATARGRRGWTRRRIRYRYMPYAIPKLHTFRMMMF